MIIIFLFYLLGGSFIDDMAFVILITPILSPAVVKLGYDPVWFGRAMVGVTLMVGSIIPPVAVSVFIVKNITGESFNTIYSGVVPFLISFVVLGAILFMFPGTATWVAQSDHGEVSELFAAVRPALMAPAGQEDHALREA